MRVRGRKSQNPAGRLKDRAGNKKAPWDFSVQDASAALPQNCQTTKWILENRLLGVNVTLVIGLSGCGKDAELGVSFGTGRDEAGASRTVIEVPGKVNDPA